MAAVGVIVQVGKGGDDSCPDGIQVNIPHQFSQIRILLTSDGLISILKELPVAFMASIKSDGVARKQSSHQCGQRDFTASKEKMGMIRKKCPSIAGCLGLRQ